MGVKITIEEFHGDSDKVKMTDEMRAVMRELRALWRVYREKGGVSPSSYDEVLLAAEALHVQPNLEYMARLGDYVFDLASSGSTMDTRAAFLVGALTRDIEVTR